MNLSQPLLYMQHYWPHLLFVDNAKTLRKSKCIKTSHGSPINTCNICFYVLVKST